MRLLTASIALVAVALTTTGCGLFGGLSVSDVEKDIEKNAPLQLSVSTSTLGLEGASAGTTTPPFVSVDCPDDAKLDDGSHFTCKATVTETGTTTQPTRKTHTAVVDVTVKDDKARWQLRITS
jgi:hypothetical protein